MLKIIKICLKTSEVWFGNLHSAPAWSYSYSSRGNLELPEGRCVHSSRVTENVAACWAGSEGSASGAERWGGIYGQPWVGLTPSPLLPPAPLPASESILQDYRTAMSPLYSEYDYYVEEAWVGRGEA